MNITPEMKKIYNKIQMQVYNMIPEKWSEIYLYSAITEKIKKLPTGEMFFYYYPKSIIKNKVINLYEIPFLFKLDEGDYDVLINRLYSYMQQLREECAKRGKKVWTNITIHIKAGEFSVDYNYDDLQNSNLTEFERHVLWKYKYLKIINQYNTKEAEVINQYLSQEEALKTVALPNPDYLPQNTHAFNSSKIYTPLSVNNMVEARIMHDKINIYKEKIGLDSESLLTTELMTNKEYKKIKTDYIKTDETYYGNEMQRISRDIDIIRNNNDIEDEEEIPYNQVLTSQLLSKRII